MTSINLTIDDLIFTLNPVGGIARLYRELISRLVQLDSELHLQILVNQPGGHGFACGPNLDVIRVIPPIEYLLRPRRLWFPVRDAISPLLKSSCARKTPGAIWHSTYYSRVTEWPGKTVVTVYDLAHERFPDLFSSSSDNAFRRQKRRVVAEADFVICISSSVADDVVNILNVDRQRTRVIGLAASDSFFGPGSARVVELPRSPYILYIGDRRHYKNFSLLLNAYQQWQYRRDIRLVVVGRPWTRRELHRIATLGLADLVTLLSQPEDDYLATLYRHAEFFVYPSLIEGFGIPLLEAGATGCPVVASDIPSSKEIAGEFAFFFDPKDESSLHAAMDRALYLGHDRSRLDRARHIAAHYSWDRTARETLDVYRMLS